MSNVPVFTTIAFAPLDDQRADLEPDDLGVDPRLLRIALVEPVRAR